MDVTHLHRFTSAIGHCGGRLSFEKSDLSSSAEYTHQHRAARQCRDLPHGEFLRAVLGRLIDETLEPSMGRFDLSSHMRELVTATRISVFLGNQICTHRMTG